MNLGLAVFASVVLVLAVYHKPFRKVLLYTIAVGAVLAAIGFGGVYLYERHEAATYEAHRRAVGSCVERNKNVGNVLEQIAALNGKSLEEACEADSTLKITPTKAQVAPIVAVRGGDTLQITPPQNFKNGSPDFIPTIYLGHHQVYDFECGDSGEKAVKVENRGNFLACE